MNYLGAETVRQVQRVEAQRAAGPDISGRLEDAGLGPLEYVGAGELKLLGGLAVTGLRAGGERLVGFAAGKWLSHFEKHGAEVGARTAVEYLRGANALIKGGEGVETFVRSNGDKLFYREATNEFAVTNAKGDAIRTYFKPEDGKQYFIDQQR